MITGYTYAYTDIHIYTYIHILYLTIAKCCYIATCIVFCTKYLYLRLFSFAKISLARKIRRRKSDEFFPDPLSSRSSSLSLSSHRNQSRHCHAILYLIVIARAYSCVCTRSSYVTGDSEYIYNIARQARISFEKKRAPRAGR